jgi:PAS domain S-box-containing protein
MALTPDKLEIIRDATIDEKAFQRVVSLFEDEIQTLSDNVASSKPFIFNLDSIQIKLISAVMSTIPAVISMKDVDSRIIMANQSCLDMNHYDTEDELIGKTDFDIMDAEEAQSHFDMEQELLRTGNPSINKEFHYTDIDNITKWYLESKSPIHDQDGKIVGLVGVVRDITPQKLAEKSLENERNLLQTIIDHIEDRIYIKDRDNRFMIANAKVLKGQKITAEEIVGTTDFDYMPDERAQSMFEEEQTIMATGIPIIGQELFTPSNTIGEDDLWFLVSKMPVYDENGVVTGLVGINSNITRQKRSEKAFEAERNLLQTLIDHIEDKIYIKDRDSRFIVANAQTLRAQQVSSEELLETTDFDYMPHERAQRMFDEEQEIMETGIPIINQELFTPSEVTNSNGCGYFTF